MQIIESESTVCIVEEHAAGGDLLKKIKKQSRINEIEARFYFRQLIEALMYLKKIEVVHRDLKCENLFLDACDNIKLGDFGFSRMMRNGDESHTFCGSRAYVAPEVLRSRAYSGYTVDLWSAGVVLFVMITGLMPYDDRFPRKMVEKQMQHRVTFPSRITLSDDVKQLIFAMLHPVPSERIPYDEIVQSAWLALTPYQFRSSSNIEQISPS
ncbi:unnamed protein product [Toxocara canis]|uniref:Protein kinase domain-containing protein n=1 Tax=Toxocara canis TaxID=6265 RepID=A0A3P7F4Q4_TOXCA|nr:unnamed protein product [Toxocara canis]